MDLTKEMNVTKPFGPTVGEIQVIPQFVKDLNDYSNAIIKDKEKAKSLDAGNTLVGAVTQEIALEKEFFNSKISPYLSNMIAAYMFKSRPDLNIKSIDEFKKKLIINYRTAWIVRQFENEYNPTHWHGGHISGAGFLKIPKTLGRHVQEKQNREYRGGNLQLIHGSRMFLCHSTMNIIPKVGDFYFFPNYLMHSVYPFYESNAVSYTHLTLPTTPYV